MNRLIFLPLLLASLLVGCSTSGGTIGGLFPAPKFLAGEVNNSIYTSKDKTFSVATPYKEGTYSYKYMQVKEQVLPHGFYVSFGPAVNQNIYRVETTNWRANDNQNVDFDSAAQKIIENYSTQLENGYGSPLKITARQNEKLNGRKSPFWRLSQLVPAGKFLSNHSVVLIHEAYVIDFGNNAAIVWVQATEDASHIMETRAFAESLVFH